jgi:hypothetical protein
LRVIRTLRLALLALLAGFFLSCFVARVASGQTRYLTVNLPACVNNSPREAFVVDAATQIDCGVTGGGTAESHCCCQDGVWAACGTAAAGGGGGDSITVNSSAATNPDFLNGDIDWTLTGGNSITATVNCSGCVDVTDIGADAVDSSEIAANAVAASEIASDAVTEPKLKAVNSPTDEYVLTYETTTGDFEWQVDQGSSGNRLPSILNPPASAGTYDCEFNSGVSGCSGWSISGSASSGTVDPFTQQTSIYYDTSTWPGWLLVQGDNSSATVTAIASVSITQATNEKWIFSVYASGGTNATNEGRSGICYSNSGDNNEFVCAGLHNASGNEVVELYCMNNGAITVVTFGSLNTFPIVSHVYVLFKRTNTYYLSVFPDSGIGGHSTVALTGASCAKTGVTTLDTMGWYSGSANENPSPIVGVNFVRYQADTDFGLINQ